jgi:hypothetical protein
MSSLFDDKKHIGLKKLFGLIVVLLLTVMNLSPLTFMVKYSIILGLDIVVILFLLLKLIVNKNNKKISSIIHLLAAIIILICIFIYR